MSVKQTDRTMKRIIIALMAAALLMQPAISVAEKNRAGREEHKAKMSKMHTNMGLMAGITDKMQQMMSTGRMTPEQQSQIWNMMKQMSRMMREMAVPHGEQVKKRHNHELKKMRNKLDSL